MSPPCPPPVLRASPGFPHAPRSVRTPPELLHGALPLPAPLCPCSLRPQMCPGLLRAAPPGRGCTAGMNVPCCTSPFCPPRLCVHPRPAAGGCWVCISYLPLCGCICTDGMCVCAVWGCTAVLVHIFYSGPGSLLYLPLTWGNSAYQSLQHFGVLHTQPKVFLPSVGHARAAFCSGLCPSEQPGCAGCLAVLPGFRGIRVLSVTFQPLLPAGTGPCGSFRHLFPRPCSTCAYGTRCSPAELRDAAVPLMQKA